MPVKYHNVNSSWSISWIFVKSIISTMSFNKLISILSPRSFEIYAISSSYMTRPLFISNLEKARSTSFSMTTLSLSKPCVMESATSCSSIVSPSWSYTAHLLLISLTCSSSPSSISSEDRNHVMTADVPYQRKKESWMSKSINLY